MRKIFFFILVFFALATNKLFASPLSKARLDSLEKQYSTYSDSIKYEHFYEYTIDIRHKDRKFCLDFAHDVLSFCVHKKLKLPEVIMLNLISDYYKEESNISNSIKYSLYQLEKISEYGIIDEYKVSPLANLAMIFMQYNLTDISKEYASNCYKILQKLKTNSNQEIYVYDIVAQLLYQFEEYHKALEIINIITSKTISKKQFITQFICNKILIAKCYDKLKNYSHRDIAIEELFEIVKNKKNSDNNLIMLIRNSISSLYYEQGKYNKAIEMLQYDLKNNITTFDTQKWHAIINRDISLNYFRLKKYDQAIKYATYYYEISLKNNFGIDIKNALRILIDIYDNKNEKRLAYKYLKNLSAFNDSTNKIFQGEFIYKLLNRYYIDSKEQNNKKLIIEKKIAELELIEKERTLKLVLILLFISVILVGIAGYYYLKNNSYLQKLKEQSESIQEKNKLLKSQNDQLTVLNNEISNITNAVSHDLKSPLNRIQALLEFVEDDKSLNNNSLEFIKIAKKEIFSSKELIYSILDEAKTYESIAKEEVCISDLINNSLDSYAYESSKKNIKLVRNVKEKIIFTTSQSDFERIFNNIISNAIKFSPFEKSIYISLVEHPNKILLSVKDEGPGISEEDQKNLFKKFTKLTNKPTGDENSTGLGMYITKHLVENLEGTINVYSSLGNGTIFEIAFKK